MNDEVLYRCSDCKEERPQSEFGKDSSKKRGFDYRCKVCKRKHGAKEYVKSKENGYHKDWHLQTRYGISLKEKEHMIEMQNGLCLICQQEMKIANVDHDHSDGSIRGILCQKCNAAIGLLSDDIATIGRAAEYLMKHKEGQLRVAFWDLETTGLSAKAGDIILSCVVLPFDGNEPLVIGNTETPDDLSISVDIRDVLSGYDRVIGWNSISFDSTFLHQRLAINGERGFLHRGNIDLKNIAKSRFPYLDGRQDTFCQIFEINHQKTPLDIELNRKLGRGEGTPEEWKSLIHHNIEDVLGMQELYGHIMNYAT